MGVIFASLTMSAQVRVIKKDGLQATRDYMAEFVLKQNTARMAAPRKALAANQQYMGTYTSDSYSTNGMGLTDYPGVYTLLAEVPVELIKAYDNGLVTGMRFAMAQAANTSKVTIIAVKKDNTMETLIEYPVETSTAGWNDINFGEDAFRLDLSNVALLLMGFDYKQTSNNFPISVVNEGLICPTDLYGNPGNNGLGYYDIGLSNYGNLSVQAIVEKNYANIGVSAVYANDMFVKKGETANIPVALLNEGLDGVESVAYTVTRNGQTGEEQMVNIQPAIKDFSTLFNINVPISSSTTAGTEDITITITKVNGVDNPSLANASVVVKFTTVEKLFKHNVAVEEFTGVTCQYCPRGWQGMENLRESFGDSFIGIAIHQYSGSSSQDAMNIATTNYARLTFQGAPSCRIERGEEMDPYAGSNGDIRDDFSKALENVAECGIEVNGVLSADKKTVEAKAVIESFIDGNNYNVEFVVIADSLSGTGTNWKQVNTFYTTPQSSLPEDMWKFGKGGQYGQSRCVNLNYNDVALASSYVKSENQVPYIQNLAAYTPVEREFTLTMPTYTSLVNAIANTEYRNVYVVALVINRTTGRIVNAAKSQVIVEEMDGTSINDIDQSLFISEKKPLYNLSGQKVNNMYRGIVIKDGKKILK